MSTKRPFAEDKTKRSEDNPNSETKNIDVRHDSFYTFCKNITSLLSSGNEAWPCRWKGVHIVRRLPSYEGNRLLECDAVQFGRYNDISEKKVVSNMRVVSRW